jgi:hypothetical protein
LKKPAGLAPGGFLFDLTANMRTPLFGSARLDIDAGYTQLHAGPSIPIPVLIAVVAVAIGPLVNHLVMVVFIEASGSAEVPAANLFAHPGDRFGDAKLLGGAPQAGRARRRSGIRLS